MDARGCAVRSDMHDQQQLQNLLNPFDDLPLECDGMTRVLSFALREAGVPHVAKSGEVIIDVEAVVPVHYWLELEDGAIVDFRARMWAGDEAHVPHGVFRPEDFPRVYYSGEVVDVSIARVVFDVLTRDRSRDVPGRC